MADTDQVQLTTDELFRQAVAEPPAETPPAEPTPEPAAPEPAPPPPADQGATPAPAPEAAIPSWRLREEAEARRLAEQRAQQLEARLNEITTHLRQTEKKPDFFENPDQATQQLVLRTLQPYAEATQKTLMAMGKMVATAVHGQDTVEQAEQAFLRAREDGSLDQADYERVVGAPNRYDAAVQWHKRQAVLSSVGTDPNAWFEKQLEAKMADPQFQAKLLEKVRGNAASKPSQVKIPPSLSKATAAASNTEVLGDMSDASLFAHAMKK